MERNTHFLQTHFGQTHFEQTHFRPELVEELLLLGGASVSITARLRRDEQDVMEIISIILASGVLDDD